MTGPEPVLPSDGPAAPPRSNGELVFSAPWESRLFGLTLALYERGRFAWPEFQRRLIDAIARREREAGEADEFHYYACWLDAFVALADDKGWIASEALGALERELATRPAGHDH